MGIGDWGIGDWGFIIDENEKMKKNINDLTNKYNLLNEKIC